MPWTILPVFIPSRESVCRPPSLPRRRKAVIRACRKDAPDPSRDRSGEVEVRRAALTDSLQWRAANAQSISAAAQLGGVRYGDPRGTRPLHRHTPRRQPSRPIRTSGEKAPPERIRSYEQTARQMQKALRADDLRSFKCHSDLSLFDPHGLQCGQFCELPSSRMPRLQPKEAVYARPAQSQEPRHAPAGYALYDVCF